MSLSLKRPALALPSTSNPAKRRKPSVASVNSAHPLRQTSFPPPDQHAGLSRPQYSPASGADEELDVDDEITSAVGSTAGQSRATKGKHKGKSNKTARSVTAGGRSVTGDTSTVVSGQGRRRPTSTLGGREQDGEEGNSDESDENDDDDGGFGGTGLSGKLSRATLEKQKEERAAFLDALPEEHLARYDLWNRIVLKKEVVRRLTNQTLSQSVPSNVVMTVNAYTKVFAGEIVDRARQVQREWVAAARELPTGEANKQTQGMGAAKVKEHDMGPLLPDHLREALRRYKHDRDGGSVGFTGLSLEGRESVASRVNGKRLFR